MNKQILSEEFIRMQKLAGIITELQLHENVDLLQFIRENQKEIAQKLNANRLEGIEMGGGEVGANIITNSKYGGPGRELAEFILFSTEPLKSNNKDEHTLGEIEIKGRIIYYDIDNSESFLLPGPDRRSKLDKWVGKAYDQSSLFRDVADIFIKPDLGVSSNNRFKLKKMFEAKENLLDKYEKLFKDNEPLIEKIKSFRETFRQYLVSDSKDLKKLSREDKTRLSDMIRNLTGVIDDDLSKNKK